jgi:hypothetical protein
MDELRNTRNSYYIHDSNTVSVNFQPDESGSTTVFHVNGEEEYGINIREFHTNGYLVIYCIGCGNGMPSYFPREIYAAEVDLYPEVVYSFNNYPDKVFTDKDGYLSIHAMVMLPPSEAERAMKRMHDGYNSFYEPPANIEPFKRFYERRLRGWCSVGYDSSLSNNFGTGRNWFRVYKYSSKPSDGSELVIRGNLIWLSEEDMEDLVSAGISIVDLKRSDLLGIDDWSGVEFPDNFHLEIDSKLIIFKNKAARDAVKAIKNTRLQGTKVVFERNGRPIEYASDIQDTIDYGLEHGMFSDSPVNGGNEP